MPLDAVVIDERTLEQGSDARRIEWEANIREFLTQAKDSVTDGATELHIGVTEQHFLMRLNNNAGTEIARKTITHDLLADHITEYVDIVRQIADAQGLNQLEALDMAKKVTHDRAGRTLKKELRPFGVDHEASRRLFTLLLSLRVDTTRLVGIHGHRTIR